MSNINFGFFFNKYKNSWIREVNNYIITFIDNKWSQQHYDIVDIINNSLKVLDNCYLLYGSYTGNFFNDEVSYNMLMNIFRDFTPRIYFYQTKLNALKDGVGLIQNQEVEGGFGYGGFDNPQVDPNSIFQGNRSKMNNKTYANEELIKFMDEIKMDLCNKLIIRIREELLEWVL